MRILITGGSGLLGQYLNIELSKNSEILSLYNLNEGNCRIYNSIKCDVRDFKLLKKIFKEFVPEAVVHTACYSRPELCARLPREEVRTVNVKATEYIAKLCNENNAKLLYTSTDLVYKSTETGMVDEDSELNPLTLYAETKLEGESAVRKYSDNYVILRTALLIGFGLNHSRNNFHNVFENLKNGKKVSLFTDQFRTPLSLTQASEFISKFIFSSIKKETINFGGPDRVSRYRIGELICEKAGFEKKMLEKISCREKNDIVQVPDVSMNTSKLRYFGCKQLSIGDSVEKIIKDLKQGN